MLVPLRLSWRSIALGLALLGSSLAQESLLLSHKCDGETAEVRLANVDFSTPGRFSELDNQDSARCQRQSSSTPGTITYKLDKSVSSSEVVLFLNERSNDQLWLTTGPGDNRIDFPVGGAVASGSGLQAANQCSTIESGNTIKLCRVDSSAWLQVTWTLAFDQCVESFTIHLSGSSDRAPISIGSVDLTGPSGSCAKSSAAVVPIVAGIIGAAVAVVVAALIWLKFCRSGRKEKGQSQLENWNSEQEHSHLAMEMPSDVQHGGVGAGAVANGESVPQNPNKQREGGKQNNTKIPANPSVTHPPQPDPAPPKKAPSVIKPAQDPPPSAPVTTKEPSPPMRHVPSLPKMEVADMNSDDGLEGGPTDAAEEVDPDQQKLLQEVHMRQAAGITQMIQGARENLMSQQTLKKGPVQETKLEVLERIGGGGFGEVFKGLFKGESVAVKIMKIKPGAKQEALTELPYTEAAIAGICVHPNIVQTMYSDLLPVFTSPGAEKAWKQGGRQLNSVQSKHVKEWDVRMVMEICDLGSVRDWVSHAANQEHGPFYSSVPKKWGHPGCGRTLCALLTSLDVARGMKLLHKYKILHGDLKPHNVLLVSSSVDPRGFTAKLSDFGLSMKMAVHDGEVANIKYGTVQYLAHEVLKSHIMTTKADVYSFGIIMWEVWHSRLFAEFYNLEKKKRREQGRTMDSYRPVVSSKCPGEYVKLMNLCLHYDPEQRPDFLGGTFNVVHELERLTYEEMLKLQRY